MTLAWEDLGAPGEPYVETRIVEDGGATAKDKMGAVEGGSCSSPPTVPLAEIIRGDIVVTDAEPEPSAG